MAFPSCSHARERVRLLFLWLLVLGCCPLARAQRYPILPVAGSPPNITALLQDGQSRLWVGTVDNVWCFDGARFYSLRSFGFPAERVTSLAEDSRGGIWIGTDGDIARGGSNPGAAWIYRGDKVTQVLPGPVQSILHVSSQYMLLSQYGSDFGDLYRMDATASGWKPKLLASKAAYSLSASWDGDIYFPCPGGACELTPDQIAHWSTGQQVTRIVEMWGASFPHRIFRDQFGCLWNRNEISASLSCPGTRHLQGQIVPTSIISPDSSNFWPKRPMDRC